MASSCEAGPRAAWAAEARAPTISCEHEIAAAARRYDIPLAVFYAVGLNETGAGGRLRPYAMNIDGRAFADTTLAAATARFRDAKAAGSRMIDIGCMQINHHYHGAQFRTLDAMFDPAQNIDYAARFLRDLKQRERTWTMAVARYNAGPDNDPAQKKYVCGVLAKMIASGFGAWTESAKNFCAVSAGADGRRKAGDVAKPTVSPAKSAAQPTCSALIRFVSGALYRILTARRPPRSIKG